MVFSSQLQQCQVRNILWEMLQQCANLSWGLAEKLQFVADCLEMLCVVIIQLCGSVSAFIIPSPVFQRLICQL